MTATHDAVCVRCGEFRRIKARGLCRRCYNLVWNRSNGETIRAANQRWRDRNPEKLRESRQKKVRDPVKRKAQSVVSNAIRDGKLERQPCEVCGAERSQGHHEDYSKPLDVRWLCQLHHAAEHLQDLGSLGGRGGDKNPVGAGSGMDRRQRTGGDSSQLYPLTPPTENRPALPQCMDCGQEISLSEAVVLSPDERIEGALVYCLRCWDGR